MTRPHNRALTVYAAILIAAIAAVATAQRAAAVVPGGTNILHVPMAWCIVTGSTAQAAPNIRSEGSTVADTNTDAVIWRRHERPTDNIFMPQATISLRSAINNAWGTFNFPVIADPDTARGLGGDVNGWNVNTDGVEFTTLINNCDTAYTNAGRAGIGVTAVNVNLFHDNANAASDGNTQFDYVTVIGWGGCNETTAGTCATPYDGRVMVIDNNFLYPTVADRTWPPSPADPAGNLRFSLTDPLDGLTGHETGHALSLDHRGVTTALMNPSIADNNSDARADNIALDATEVAALRANAGNVPGLETDPPGEFVPGAMLAMRLVDGARDRKLSRHFDLASVKVTLDEKRDRAFVGSQLWGLLPCRQLSPTTFGTLVDLDNDVTTGARQGQLAELGLPARFAGADLVVRATVVRGSTPGPFYSTCRLKRAAWLVRDGELTPLPRKIVDVQIQTLRLYPHFAPVKGLRQPKDFVAEVYNTVVVLVENRALPVKIRRGEKFRVGSVVATGGRTVDQFGEGDRGGTFVLERPDFPHCFPAGPVRAGRTVPVSFDGLRPSREIHALLGPIEVLRGVSSNAQGAGRIRLPIPPKTRPGKHLVTIGHDGLALTADCTVTVRR